MTSKIRKAFDKAFAVVVEQALILTGGMPRKPPRQPQVVNVHNVYVEAGKDAGENFADEFRVYPCVECGEEVPAGECYTDSGEVIHAIGVTGLVEPHETGTQAP